MINEKILLQFMKEAIKGGGLKVRRMDWHSTDYYIVHSGWWALVSPTQCMPSKALALITQYARQLPLIGQAWHITSKEATAILDVESIGSGFIKTIENGDINIPTKFTGLISEGNSILQRKDLSIVLAAEEARTMLLGKENTGLTDIKSNMVLWQDVDDEIYFITGAQKNLKPSRFAQLMQHNYWEDSANEY